jgi:quinoprotein relay system zinc metallohydrolase 1
MIQRFAVLSLLLVSCFFTVAVQANELDYQLKPRALAPNVYVIEGANDDFTPKNGCNIINTGFIVTSEGVLVINTGPSRLYGEQMRAAIKSVTPAAISRVIHLNLHPDYFLGNQAFSDTPRFATAKTSAGMAAESSSYEDNMYKLCGDWMKGTQTLLPNQPLLPGAFKLGDRNFELREFSGHTDSDMVLIDKASGVVFIGGLVFVSRNPTTPHANPTVWLKSLDQITALEFKTMVPSHGPVVSDGSGIEQTQSFLKWMDATFKQAASQGMEMNELLRIKVPAPFSQWAAFSTEYVRNVAHLYPKYEQQALQSPGQKSK